MIVTEEDEEMGKAYNRKVGGWCRISSKEKCIRENRER